MKVTMCSLLLFTFSCFVSASQQPLVQCALPVEVKFIVTPQQQQPTFKDMGTELVKGHGCTLNAAAWHVDSDAEARQLQSSTNSSDDENETSSTTTSAPVNTTTTTTIIKTNVSNATANLSGSSASTTANSTGLKLNKSVDAELGAACNLNAWTTSIFSLGLSLSLPVAVAAPGDFMAPHQPRKVTEQANAVEVLMPCSALYDPLRDLDGDGALDCKMTEEQNAVAESLPEIQGTWHILSSQSVSKGNLIFANRQPQESITMGGGALCMDASATAPWEAAAFMNVERFTHDAKPCGTNQACEASMWSFDLAYPESSCTPELAGWVQPCTAKLLADGTLMLVRGARVQSGKTAGRPPLMATVTHATDALPFASGLTAATQSSFEILLLNKYQSIAEVRHLQSSDNSTEDDNETSTTTGTPVNNGNATTTTTTTSIALNVSVVNNSNTSNSTGNQSALKRSVDAELGHAQSWRVWITGFLCVCQCLLMQ